MIFMDLLILLPLVQGVYCGLGETYLGDEEVIRYVDFKEDVVLPCNHDLQTSTIWVSEGIHEAGRLVMSNGSLFLPNVTRQMTGRYICRQEQDDRVVSSINLVVRGPPDPPQNVSVHASTVVAIVTWHLHLNDNWEESPEGPKTTLHLRYRRLPSNHWLHLPHHVAPSQGQVDVYNLQPNSTYEFQLWANNSYGISDIVSVKGTTLHDVAEIELARMLEESMKGVNPRVWIVAVIVVAAVINVSGLFLLVGYCRQFKFGKSEADDPEGIELVPHIIENPGYQVDRNHNLETIHENLLTPSTASHSLTALV